MMYSKKCAQLASVCLVAANSACGNRVDSPDQNSSAGGVFTDTTVQGEAGGATASSPDQTGGVSSNSSVATGGAPASGGGNSAVGSALATGGEVQWGAGGSGNLSLSTGGARASGGGAPKSTGGASTFGGSTSHSSGGAWATGGRAPHSSGGALGTGGNGATCGDGTCGASETCSSCAQDCGACSQSCNSPVFTESDKYGQYTFPSGYMVFNNIWGGDGGPQTIYACSPSNWYVISNQPVISNSRGEIKSYPCSKWDFSGKALNTFTTITSTFAATAPDEGVWNAAYDIWLGPGGWDIEVMLWTNYRYLATLPPGGASATDSATIDGIEYYAWTYDLDYIGLAMKQPKAAGTVNFRHVFDWIVSKQWISADAQLHAFEYGVEIAETNGKALTFAVTDFSVSGQ